MKGVAAVAVVLAGVLPFAALLAAGVSGLPTPGDTFSDYAEVATRLVVDERHIANAVSGVLLDLRPLDTLIEELVLFGSVVGLGVIARENEEGEHSKEDEPTPPGLSLATLALAPVLLVIGLYIVSWGHVSPGGGFQGGVALSSIFLLILLAGHVRGYHRATREARLDPFESGGVLALAVLGLIGLAFGRLYTSFLPRGELQRLLSAGIVPIGNLAVSVAVTIGAALVASDFVEQLRMEREGSDDEEQE